MQRNAARGRLPGMNLLSRTGRPGAFITLVAVIALLTACAGTSGTASPVAGGSSVVSASSAPSVPTSGVPMSTVPASGTARASGNGPTSAPTTSESGPPTCQGSPNKLVTPVGRPMITVTQGVNAWIANRTTAPLAIALYPDGTGIVSNGFGETTKPLAPMALGWIPPCLLDWAKSEFVALAGLDMGQPNITDQGITVLTYLPATGPPVTISVYALGLGDDYLVSGNTNRARLVVLLRALRKPFVTAAPWTPDRLQVVSVTATVASAGEALVWPASVAPLEKLLVGNRSGKRCGVVSGADARAVLQTLGQRFVYARWTDHGKVTGLNIGALVPGQDGCTQP